MDSHIYGDKATLQQLNFLDKFASENGSGLPVYIKFCTADGLRMRRTVNTSINIAP